MYKDLIFLEFFEITKNCSIIHEEYLKLSMHLENPALGYRDFCFEPSLNYFSALLSDMSGISRLDSYVTNNIKMPWEKQDEGLYFSVGLLEFYKINSNSQIKFRKHFNISYPY